MLIRFLLSGFLVLSITFSYSQKNTYNINDNENHTLSGSTTSDNPSLKNSLRYREFRINPVLQQTDDIQKNDTIILDLFEDCHYKAIVTGISTTINGTTLINGRLKAYKFSSIFISTSNGKSYIQIDIPEKEELYSVNYAHDQDTYYLKQLEYIKNETLSDGERSSEDDENTVNQPQISPNNLRVTDSQETLTLLIAYTPETVKWSKENATDINNVIDIIMAKNQLVLDNSKTNVTIKLACAVEVDYKEVDMDTDYERFGNLLDGYMDEVHALRDYYYADMMLFVSGMRYNGGKGCVYSGNAEWAFAVTDPKYATFGFTAIHELGHVMGCLHQKDLYDNPAPNSFNYGWAWHDPEDDGYYCSVMTYTSKKYWPDNITRKRLPYFSNPDVNCNGIATGVANTADNARRIRETKSDISDFRTENCSKPSTPSVSITQPTTCNGKGSVKLTNLPIIWTLLRFPDNKIIQGVGSSTTVNLNPGSYSYSVIDISRCPSSLTKTITINDKTPETPVVEEIIQPSCTRRGGGVEINNLPDKGELTIHSDNGNTTEKYTTTPVYLDLSPGEYAFSVENSSGCTSDKTAKIRINDLPKIPEAPDTEVIQPGCNEDMGTVKFTGMPSGSWEVYDAENSNVKLSNGTSSSVSIPIGAGTYKFVVKNKDGCYSEETEEVEIELLPAPPVPEAEVITQPTCKQETGMVRLRNLPSGSWELFQYLPEKVKLRTGRENYADLELLSGNYSFKSKNEYGCESEESNAIRVDDQPVVKPPYITIARDPDCSDPTGSVLVSKLPEGAWTLTRLPDEKEYTGFGTTTKIEDIPAGIYSFNVTNSESCTSQNSGSFNLSLLSAVPRPLIIQNGNTLSSSPADSYQWYLFNEPIEGATNQDILVVEEGEYHVVVYDGQCYSNPSDKMYITINGISEIKTGLKVYPNPSDSKLSLKLPDNNELVQVDIFSVSGESYYSTEFTNSIHIDVKQWPSGVYFIKTFNNKLRMVNKFVKN